MASDHVEWWRGFVNHPINKEKKKSAKTKNMVVVDFDEHLF